MDTSLLEKEEYITKMSEYLTNWSPPPELENPQSIWEWLKFKIKTFTRNYTRNIHSMQKQHVDQLNKELEDLYKIMDDTKEDKSIETESVRRELREIEENHARKIIFRTKTN